MSYSPSYVYSRRLPVSIYFYVCLFLVLFLTSCAGSRGTATLTPAAAPAVAQTLTFPNVSIADLPTLDPAQDPGQNAAIVENMIYSGLVKTDKDLHVVPDQATWQISPDGKTYTFMLTPGIVFSDGTPVTAQSYVYTWTRALLPAVNSPTALAFESPIVGAGALHSGQAQTLAGVRAINATTLQVTLTQPTSSFLATLTNVLFFPLNQAIVELYGQNDWTQHVARNGIGTGPLMIESWQHNVKLVFVPNPHYYGDKTRLKEVTMPFVDDPTVAFKSSRAGQYDFTWGIDSGDLPAARVTSGFTSSPLLETDALFFDTTRPPFDNVAVRQAFAYAIDKTSLASVLNNAVVPAATILPPGIPGYETHYAGLAFDPVRASTLLHTVYSDVTQMPAIVFSFPDSRASG